MSNIARKQPRIVSYKGRQFVVDDKPFLIKPFMRIPKEERRRPATAAGPAGGDGDGDAREVEARNDKPFFISPFKRTPKPAAAHPDDAGRDPSLYACCGGTLGGPHVPVTAADRRRLGARARNRGFFDRHNLDAGLRRNGTAAHDFAYVGGGRAPRRERRRDKVLAFCLRTLETLGKCLSPDGKAARRNRELEEMWGGKRFPKY